MSYDSPNAALPAQMPLPSARDHVVELLKAGFVENHLSMTEFEQRVALAHQARSRAELDPLVADLLPAAGLAPTASPPGYTGSIANHRKIVAILSNHQRRGPMALPRHLEIVAILGNVELDLTGASIANGVTEIDISAVFGNVEVTLPPGVRIESHGNAFLGSFDHRSQEFPEYAETGDRVIRITGQSVFGSVTIEAAPAFAPPPLPQDSGAPRRLG
ncbi:MAG: DUF1707 domain-containing protein [Gemmatimonadota bacterium]|nr:DUF1707 domain-containing protein [Gemmatimonadota bacterium]